MSVTDWNTAELNHHEWQTERDDAAYQAALEDAQNEYPESSADLDLLDNADAAFGPAVIKIGFGGDERCSLTQFFESLECTPEPELPLDQIEAAIVRLAMHSAVPIEWFGSNSTYAEQQRDDDVALIQKWWQKAAVEARHGAIEEFMSVRGFDYVRP